MNRDEFSLDRLVLTTKAEGLLEKIKRKGQSHSLWILPFGTACCALEYMSAFSPRYDLAQYGVEFDRHSACQSDLMIIAGTITAKQLPLLKKLYDDMLEPKWVIAMGACASSGGPYRSYNVVQGLDKIIPVDVYIPGCPPSPEALIDGIFKIKERIDLGVNAHRGVEILDSLQQEASAESN